MATETMVERGVLVPIVSAEHFPLFKGLYDATIEWSAASHFTSVADHESVLLSSAHLWRMYAVNGKVIGLAGLQNVNMIDGNADPLLSIVEHERRKGHGTSMMRSLIECGFSGLNLRRLHTMVLTGSPSVGILERTGFSHEATLGRARFKNGEYGDVLGYRLFREDYK